MSGTITFPSNPTLNQTFTAAGTTWTWNGTQWVNATTAGSYATTAQANALIPQNAIDNAGFTVNQRAYTSGTALAAGAYGLDRWKAGAAGCTLTFAAAQAATVVTITAGSLQQVVEGVSLVSGAYTLSWTGTAQGRIANTAGGGSYAASPIAFTATANTNAFVEFNAGTLSRVQLQIGSVATPWQPQPPAVDEVRCQRFYQAGHVNLGGPGVTQTGSVAMTDIVFAVTMRGNPTVATPPPWNLSGAASTITPGGSSPQGFSPTIGFVTGNWFAASGNWTASADL